MQTNQSSHTGAVCDVNNEDEQPSSHTVSAKRDREQCLACLHFIIIISTLPAQAGMSVLLKQHLNTHKQQLRALGLQIIIHHTHAPVHKHSHRPCIALGWLHTCMQQSPARFIAMRQS
jgi:hypothetical protein